MARIIYFTGGARSGKSTQAEQYIANGNYEHKIYLATAIPFDDEMKERIRQHVMQRGKSWDTIEGFRNLFSLVEPLLQAKRGVVLLDCLSNMVSNLLLEQEEDWERISQERLQSLEKAIVEEVRTFLREMKETSYDVVLVSNEVGMSLVPDYPLGRYFRDICGRANQLVCTFSEEAYFIVSGARLRLK